MSDLKRHAAVEHQRTSLGASMLGIHLHQVCARIDHSSGNRLLAAKSLSEDYKLRWRFRLTDLAPLTMLPFYFKEKPLILASLSIVWHSLDNHRESLTAPFRTNGQRSMRNYVQSFEQSQLVGSRANLRVQEFIHDLVGLHSVVLLPRCERRKNKRHFA